MQQQAIFLAPAVFIVEVAGRAAVFMCPIGYRVGEDELVWHRFF